MMPTLSPNTRAILLLIAPLIAGRSELVSDDLLSPGEYKRLARHLREVKCQPADLLSPNAAELLHACGSIVDEGRLRRLLGRGFLLSQVIERWQTRAIWVVSRADAEYPRRLKVRLREDAPPVLYGCGEISLLDTGGLAVVGSRHVDDSLIDYTLDVGRLAAYAHKTLVSGGARGVDQAAMRGALAAGGNVVGVLADSLEKIAMTREQRNSLVEGCLALISPYDPSVGFNVGRAMQRNKLIYALGEASLVVNSDMNRGGTWAGAVEQLDKLKFVPVYIRSTGYPSVGLDALRQKGAIPWPNPQDVESFESLFDRSSMPQHGSTDAPSAEHAAKPTSSETVQDSQIGSATSAAVAGAGQERTEAAEEERASVTTVPAAATGQIQSSTEADISPADVLFAAVRESIQRLLNTPMKEVDVAAALQVSTPQAKAWLQRLVDEGAVEKAKKPAGFVAKQRRLL
ncbi:DNA-processing protein DprA [Trinickia dinghuensis]|uniref:DNA-processing protein DprA n=1 Tax=Trinickia dinghuensis TaxID=2291023 RepID=A0A3D8JZH7_9BURK|nr:DNA-processing protein DprA [Trinickia dinghuensis]RDU98232.1 DNA-processing protein DprA [Trinickia dinghuensis]